jgi:hypothetical protein
MSAERHSFTGYGRFDVASKPDLGQWHIGRADRSLSQVVKDSRRRGVLSPGGAVKLLAV